MDWSVDDALSEIDSSPETEIKPVNPEPKGINYLLKAAGMLGAFANPASPQNLQRAADGGAAVNDLVQRKSGDIAEWTGKNLGENAGVAAAGALTAPATLAEYAIPTSPVGVLLSMAGLGKAAGVGQMEKDIAARVAGRAKVKPGHLDKTMGQAISVRTGMRPEDAAEALADDTIVSDRTIPKETISKGYDALWKKLGTTKDKVSQALSGSRYPPMDSEVGKLREIAETAINKGDKLTPQEAVIARQALSKLTLTEAAKRDPNLRRTYANDIQLLDDMMEGMGIPKLNQLNRQWRRASIKEEFSRAMPRNKNRSPNALRGAAMAYELGEAGTSLLEGNIPRAGMKMLSAGTMSPYVLGGAVGSNTSPIMKALANSGQSELADILSANKSNGRAAK